MFNKNTTPDWPLWLSCLLIFFLVFVSSFLVDTVVIFILNLLGHFMGFYISYWWGVTITGVVGVAALLGAIYTCYGED